MKKLLPFVLAISIIYFTGLHGFKNYTNNSILQSRIIDANNISTIVHNNATMDRNPFMNTSGFEWPKDSGKYAIYVSGLWISAKVNDSVRVSASEYNPSHEFKPGYFSYQSQTPGGADDIYYRLYKVSPNFPNGNNHFDSWAVWPIGQGAPWVDANGDRIYSPPSDYPVMKGSQNLFCTFTDGYRDSLLNRRSTPPLRAEIHMYAWAKENPACADAIHYEWKIINKNISAWQEMSAALWSDVEIGTSSNDKAGTDSSLNLLYGYNGVNFDPIYGTAPPAVGYLIEEASRHSSNRASDFAARWSCGDLDCPTDSLQKFRVLHGLRSNGNPWINTISNQSTKYPYGGNPVLGTGWLDPTMGQRYTIIGSIFGTVNSRDTIMFKTVTFIKRGSNNLTSVDEIKNCVSSVIGIQQLSNSIPDGFKLHQNYPNPFNPKTKIKYQISKSSFVSLKIYNTIGKLVMTLVKQEQTPGIYEVDMDGNGLSSGVYFYSLTAGDSFSETKRMLLLK